MFDDLLFEHTEEAPVTDVYAELLAGLESDPEAVATERAAFNAQLDHTLRGTEPEFFAGDDQGALTEIAKKVAASSQVDQCVSELTAMFHEAEAKRAAIANPEPVVEEPVWTAEVPTSVLMALAEVSVNKRSVDSVPAGIDHASWRKMLRDQGMVR
jgi:hypothetical protein